MHASTRKNMKIDLAHSLFKTYIFEVWDLVYCFIKALLLIA